MHECQLSWQFSVVEKEQILTRRAATLLCCSRAEGPDYFALFGNKIPRLCPMVPLQSLIMPIRPKQVSLCAKCTTYSSTVWKLMLYYFTSFCHNSPCFWSLPAQPATAGGEESCSVSKRRIPATDNYPPPPCMQHLMRCQHILSMCLSDYERISLLVVCQGG